MLFVVVVHLVCEHFTLSPLCVLQLMFVVTLQVEFGSSNSLDLENWPANKTNKTCIKSLRGFK